MAEQKQPRQNRLQSSTPQRTESNLCLYLKAMTRGWLQITLDSFDIVGIALIVVDLLGFQCSEPALLRSIGGLVFIFSFALGNYIAFARLLDEKRELDLKLQRGGPRIIPLDVPIEKSEHPIFKISLQNAGDVVALNVRFCLHCSDFTFSNHTGSISPQHTVTIELDRNKVEGIAARLETVRSLTESGQEDESKQQTYWLLVEYEDVQRICYQFVLLARLGQRPNTGNCSTSRHMCQLRLPLTPKQNECGGCTRRDSIGVISSIPMSNLSRYTK